MNNVRDILVDTRDPQGLDGILNTFGAALIGGGMPGGFVKVDGHYIARCFGNANFIKFAITSQGYGTVIKVCDGLYDEEEATGGIDD